MEFTTSRFAAQTVRKTAELGWRPMQFLASPSNSVETVLRPAGLENANGIFTSQFTKQAADPAWANDPEVIEYIAFMKRWAPSDNPTDFVALSGDIPAQAIADGLQRCGVELTRDNIVKQASSFRGQRFKMMLPGIELNNSANDYAAYRSLRIARFDGTSWVLVDKPETSGQALYK